MQNKGAVRLFAILLALVCVYQLSFTFVARRAESKAAEYAEANLGDVSNLSHEEVEDTRKDLVNFYLDSINEDYYNIGIAKYNYKEVKQREINLGLDLKGGMNATLEISVVDLIKALANNTKDETFNEAIKMAQEKQKHSQEDFVTLFVQSFEEIDPDASLAASFLTAELKDKINLYSTNEEVKKVIKEEADAAISNSFNILRSRIDRFGVAQPNIQMLSQQGRILVELPGVKDENRVRNLLQGTASLEFWETYENQEVYPYLMEINTLLAEENKAEENLTEEATTEEVSETTEVAEESSDEESLLDELDSAEGDSTLTDDIDIAKEYPLFSVLQPNISQQNGQFFQGPVVGFSHQKDTAKVNRYIQRAYKEDILPPDLKLAWKMKAFDEDENFFQLVALKITTRDGSAPLDGSVITNARQSYGQTQSTADVDMSMNGEGAKVWSRMTQDNVGRSIAILLDGYVISHPTVQVHIKDGRSNITGNFTVEEAKDLANMLKSGKMPAPAQIVESEIVGPSLGHESINNGMWSFAIAFIVVLLYMLLIYSKRAGWVANVALVANLFFIIGVLASFGAVLTLPGIAGIVLTIGMSVDANVLIYERIQEELKAGKGIRLAVKDGYRQALSAIIDGQVTTMLTGVVLYFFGSGPIKGFATTLIIGICTSLLSALFITRLMFERKLAQDKKITFASRITENWLTHSSIKFLDKRKIAYFISGALIIGSIASLAVKKLDLGIDFRGGRSYVVRFENEVQVEDVAQSLAVAFDGAPEVKTFGSNKQVRITTDYRIDERDATVDNDVQQKLYEGLKEMAGGVSKAEFDAMIQSQSKVGPTISDDIQKGARNSMAIALIIIFLYILVRFRNWQYGLGAIAALAHDSIIVLGIFSLFSGILPFSLEINQAFIAAILTVVGYSINDTVVVFDRIREYIGLYPKREREVNTNNALNSTLRRTFSTSVSTFIVLLSIFIFGGENIRGFVFALMMGVVVGTYSSLFIATPIAYDTQKRAAKVVAKRKK